MRSTTQSPALDIRVDARALAPGEFMALTIAGPPAAGGAMHVRAFDRDWTGFTIDDRTWRVLMGIDLDVPVGTHDVAVRLDGPAGVARGVLTVTLAAKEYPTRRLTVDEAFVNPPAEVQARIEREAEELSRLWTTSPASPRWKEPFVRPVSDAANSAFGSRSIFNDQPRSPHSGADFSSREGTVVHAPAAGRVVLAKDLYYTGGTVVLDHGAGVVSLFAHLSAIDVKTGADVSTGEALGKVGATGRVTGPHLHWGIRVSGARVDPLSVLDVLGPAAR